MTKKGMIGHLYLDNRWKCFEFQRERRRRSDGG